MALPAPKTALSSQRLLRCVDWLQKQNSEDPNKLALQNKNDIQFIIQTNADRKNFLLSAAEDVASVPAGIDEPAIEPAVVPLHKLRVQNLKMECEWRTCRWQFTDYEVFQKHVKEHISELQIIKENDKTEYACLWDVCDHKTTDFQEMVRHINYHAYHSHLLAIGLNGRATLKLVRCKRDSSKRNKLPSLLTDHCCMWINCEEKFNSIQAFFDHVKLHVKYSDKFLCSWAGCGATFPRRVQLATHVRWHTSERLIACFHCGAHFACNRKLNDHLRRQNVYPNSSHSCTVCGNKFATDYLLREHARQHISAVACPLCDMSAPTPATLAQHMRYRHFSKDETLRHHARPHACPQCEYRAVTKSDLKKHIPTHNRKNKTRKKKKSKDKSDCDKERNDLEEMLDPKKNKPKKKYACHMCPKKKMKVFSRGAFLTTHLVKVHGAQWPSGHSRFRYQISEDGMYRLTTTRFEFLDVSRKIVDGYSWPKESPNNSFEFNLKLKAEATDRTPRRFEISLKTPNDDSNKVNSCTDSDDIEKTNIKTKDDNIEDEKNKSTADDVEVKKADNIKDSSNKNNANDGNIRKVGKKYSKITKKNVNRKQRIRFRFEDSERDNEDDEMDDDSNDANANDSESKPVNNDNKDKSNNVSESDKLSDDETGANVENIDVDNSVNSNSQIVEITMCDVDEEGNVINTEVMKSEVITM